MPCGSLPCSLSLSDMFPTISLQAHRPSRASLNLDPGEGRDEQGPCSCRVWSCLCLTCWLFADQGFFFFFFLHWCWLQNIAIKYSFSPMTEFEAIPLKVTQWMSHLLSPSPAPMYQVACGVSPEGASACCSSSQHASLPDCVQTSAHMAPSGAALLDHPLWNNAPLPVTFCFVASQSSHLYLTWYHTFACHLYLVKCEF